MRARMDKVETHVTLDTKHRMRTDKNKYKQKHNTEN